MNTKRYPAFAVAALAGLGMVLAAVASADATAVPRMKQVGATAIVYHGPKLDVALSYRYAKYNPHGDWLMLDTQMAAASDPIEVPRTAIAVRTPDGEVVPLATQAEFEHAYPSLLAEIQRANVAREPMNYLIPHRATSMRYFAVPGRGITFGSVWLDNWHSSFGRLYFRLPHGVHKGNYQLLIDLPGDQVSIPFTL